MLGCAPPAGVTMSAAVLVQTQYTQDAPVFDLLG